MIFRHENCGGLGLTDVFMHIHFILFQKDLVCRERYEVGPCRDFENRYYFDIESRTCKTFRYGGCPPRDGNFQYNNFM